MQFQNQPFRFAVELLACGHSFAPRIGDAKVFHIAGRAGSRSRQGEQPATRVHVGCALIAPKSAIPCISDVEPEDRFDLSFAVEACQ